MITKVKIKFEGRTPWGTLAKDGMVWFKTIASERESLGLGKQAGLPIEVLRREGRVIQEKKIR